MNNPYNAPGADLSQQPGDTAPYTPAFFALDGRLGRARYVAYGTGLALLMAVVLMVFETIWLYAGFDYWLVTFVPLMLTLLMFIAFLVVARRRLNDMNRSGWLSLLIFVPIVNLALGLWLLFGRGNEGANAYGPPPCENSTGVRVVCVVAGIFALTSTLTVAISAYGAYKVAQLGMSGNVLPSAQQAPR